MSDLTHPLISVVIPAYNVGLYIEECLESVKRQSYSNFEAIVINDGSTDNTLEIIEDTISGDKRFKLFSQNNAGLSATRNRGMQECHGKYLYFLDSDDKITYDFFDEAVNKMESLNLDVLTFNASSFMDGKPITSGFNADNYVRTLPENTSDPILHFLLTEQFRSPVWLYFYRFEFITGNKLTFKEGILHEDELFSLIACVTAQKTAFTNKSYFERRVRENSIMTSKKTFKNSKSYFEVFKYSALWYDQFKGNNTSKYSFVVRKRISMFYLWALRGALERGELNRFRQIALPNFILILRYVRPKNALAILFPESLSKRLSS